MLYANVSGDFHPSHNGIRRETVGGVLTYTYVHPNLTPRWEKGRRLQRTRMLESLVPPSGEGMGQARRGEPAFLPSGV